MKSRIWGVFAALLLVFTAVIARIVTVVYSGETAAVGLDQNTRSVTVTTLRGTIYDRSRLPLVNAEKEYLAALLPDESLLPRLKAAMLPSDYSNLLVQLRGRTPTVARLLEPVAIANGLRLFLTPVRYGEYCPAPHLIGYLDGSGQHGVTGIEQAYDAVLNEHYGEIKVTFQVNGAGEYLAGESPQVTNSLDNSSGGVVLTIDRDIQQIVDETAPDYLSKGAVIVLNPLSGDVLACASFPTFHPSLIADSVERTDGVLVNRVLSLYDCGSVFKIVTAAAALESGVSVEQVYDCAGGMTVGNVTFHCHKRLGHQELDMEEAFAQSCNLYFIQLAAQIGAEKLLEMADLLGLNESIQLAETLCAPAAVLPTQQDLSAPAALANLSFGQGRLLLSPLHVARLTAVVAANGTIPSLQVVMGTVDCHGTLTMQEKRGGETVISAATIKALRRMMERVVTDGTGVRAQPVDTSAAGKTGTAETGQLNGGNAVVQSWFTGYIPADDPQYVITIVAEDAQNTGGDTAGLFCEISNKLMKRKRNGD